MYWRGFFSPSSSSPALNLTMILFFCKMCNYDWRKWGGENKRDNRKPYYIWLPQKIFKCPLCLEVAQCCVKVEFESWQLYFQLLYKVSLNFSFLILSYFFCEVSWCENLVTYTCNDIRDQKVSQRCPTVKWKPSFIVGRLINWLNLYGNQYGDFSKIANRTIILSGYSTARHHSQEHRSTNLEVYKHQCLSEYYLQLPRSANNPSAQSQMSG